MRHLSRPAGLAVGLLAVALSPLSWTTVPAADAGTATQLTVATLTFPVTNTNSTPLACTADGASYTLRARLVGPTRVLADRQVQRVNLLVHDFTAGRWFWSMPGHPGYDYAAALARAGEVTIAIDRLGYDGSPLPDGTATYVVMHGHSVGAGIAELEAGMFGDVAGLVVMSWSDSGPTQRAITESLTQHSSCLTGDYAWYGQTAKDFRQLLFLSAPLSVQRDATRLRNQDPCGDAESLAQLVQTNAGLNRRIDAPVLLLYGARDALTGPDSRDQQLMAYSRSAHVTMRVLPGTGSALPLEASAPTTRRIVARWLCAAFACGVEL